MRTVKLAGKTVELYDDIESLPMLRYHKYNKMLLIDAGVGSDLADFDKHIEKAMRLAKGKTPQLAVTELENLRQNVYFIQSEVSPRYLAFAALVKSIDGTPCEDLTDDGLQKVLKKLSTATNKEVTAQLDAVKKKIDEELHLYFPRLFDDANVKEYFDILKQRTVKVLKTVIDGNATEEDAKEIDRLTGELITYFNPQCFSGSESVEIQHDKNFERMCLLLSENLHINPKTYTVLEYYNAFEYLKEMAKKASKKPNK